MRQTGITKGKKITVEYDVVLPEVRRDGLTADKVLMDEAQKLTPKVILKSEGIEL